MRGMGQVGEAFAAAVAGGRGLHQAGVGGVLHVAAQDAVFDQHVALADVAFVVDVERATAIRQVPSSSTVTPFGGYAGRCDGEHAGALAVEVACRPWPTASQQGCRASRSRAPRSSRQRALGVIRG